MKTALTAAAVLAIAGSAAAQTSNVLLIVDNTDPSNVVFSATGAPADVVASVGIINGVTLIGLFDGAGLTLPIGNVIGGNLSPNGNPGAYNRAGNDFGTLSANDLNFWGSGVGGTQTFNTTDPAFSGATAGIDYSAGSFNGSGEIRLGDTVTGVVIGSWQLIPTPGAVALFGIAGLAATRRRRA